VGDAGTRHAHECRRADYASSMNIAQ
jgi:hypothetical protein